MHDKRRPRTTRIGAVSVTACVVERGEAEAREVDDVFALADFGEDVVAGPADQDVFSGAQISKPVLSA